VERRKPNGGGNFGKGDVLVEMSRQKVVDPLQLPGRKASAIQLALNAAPSDKAGMLPQEMDGDVLPQRIHSQSRQRLLVPHLGNHFSAEMIKNAVVGTMRVDEVSRHVRKVRLACKIVDEGGRNVDVEDLDWSGRDGSWPLPRSNEIYLSGGEAMAKRLSAIKKHVGLMRRELEAEYVPLEIGLGPNLLNLVRFGGPKRGR